MWALTGKQTKWSATAGLVMSLPWTEAVLSLSFCLWKEVVSMLHSPLRPWDWRRLTLVENLWLEIRTEEKYLTEKKHLLLKARQSCNFFLFFLCYNPLNFIPSVLWMVCKCWMFPFSYWTRSSTWRYKQWSTSMKFELHIVSTFLFENNKKKTNTNSLKPFKPVAAADGVKEDTASMS